MVINVGVRELPVIAGEEGHPACKKSSFGNPIGFASEAFEYMAFYVFLYFQCIYLSTVYILCSTGQVPEIKRFDLI